VTATLDGPHLTEHDKLAIEDPVRPASRFPALAACGVHAWDGDRDRRFTTGLETLLRGIEAHRPAPGG
jgi:hypothetical protein